MARSREWADVPHSPIDLTPNQVGGLRSIGRRAVPYLTSRWGIWGFLLDAAPIESGVHAPIEREVYAQSRRRAGYMPLCQRTDIRPCFRQTERWCEERSLEPLSGTLGSILSYLQLMVDKGLAHATVKVYAAAISSCHAGFGGRPVFSQPLMKRFLRPVVHVSTLQWELPLVLEALVT